MEAAKNVVDGKYFRMNDIIDNYVPLLFLWMKHENPIIRNIGVDNMLKILKINFFSKKRLEIIKNINEKFRNSSSYSSRMVYIRFCIGFVEKFSRNYIRMFLLPDCMSLSKDKVNIVRGKFAEFLLILRKKN